jgi:hypothetical protein
VLVACALLVGAACTPGGGEPSCAADADCPWNARCVASACVTNAPPLPSLVLPSGPIEANVLLSFDASASHDPDVGDAVVSHAWSFRSAGAPCEPPVVAGTGPLASARFGCAGRYEVDLTVTDVLGASATATEPLEVQPYSGPALVTVGPDVALDHACTASPARCAPVGQAALSAAAPGLAPEGLVFEWTVEPPPDRPLGAGRRVTFTPSRFVASPTVLVETDGQAISGDWTFRVEVRDGAGLLGAGVVKVAVKNRPPEVEFVLPQPDHAFDGVALTAGGEIPFTVTDPDGDALVGPSVEWHHTGDGPGTFSGQVAAAPPRVTFAVSVPYVTPSDGRYLIGGPGLERTISFTVSDVNGAAVTERWPIAIRNRAPVFVAKPGAVAVDHWFDSDASAYRATVPLSTWLDPDGDPLFQVPSAPTGDPLCTVAVPDGSGERVAEARCSLAFLGTPAVANFAGPHTVAQAIQDPWTAAAQQSTVAFTIGNRSPASPSTATHVVTGACALTTSCCRPSADGCNGFRANAGATTSGVPPRWSDPDGDPLGVSAIPADWVDARPLVCTAGACTLRLDVAARQVCGTTTVTLSTVITDGLATAAGVSLPVERRCPLD